MAAYTRTVSGAAWEFACRLDWFWNGCCRESANQLSTDKNPGMLVSLLPRKFKDNLVVKIRFINVFPNTTVFFCSVTRFHLDVEMTLRFIKSARFSYLQFAAKHRYNVGLGYINKWFLWKSGRLRWYLSQRVVTKAKLAIVTGYLISCFVCTWSLVFFVSLFTNPNIKFRHLKSDSNMAN